MSAISHAFLACDAQSLWALVYGELPTSEHPWRFADTHRLVMCKFAQRKTDIVCRPNDRRCAYCLGLKQFILTQGYCLFNMRRAALFSSL
jgi:hypothetical protein